MRFKKYFFPYFVKVWNYLKPDIRNALFSVYGEKLLTRLRLNSSHLKEHKFRHGFADTINPMWTCGADVETTEHFLMRCHFYSTQRFELFDNPERVNSDFKNVSGKDQVSFMLYSSKTKNQNIKIVIKYL